MSEPVVSVILTSFNHDRFIGLAIESVLSQTFGDFELFIYDDQSTDGSWDVIKSYQDPRIKPIRGEKKRRQKPINTVLSSGMLRGEYVAIHHSDDVWLPNKLEKQVAVLQARTDLGAVFTHAVAIDERGAALPAGNHNYTSVFEQDNKPRHGWLRHFLLNGNGLCHPSAMLRQTTYKALGFYNESLFQLADFEMWIRLCTNFDIHVIPESLTRFRVLANEANMSGDRPDTRNRLALEWPQVLKAYTRIQDVEVIREAFPEVANLQEMQSADVPLLFALAVLKITSEPLHRAFALSLLQEALADRARHDEIALRFGYDTDALHRDCGLVDLLNDGLLRERLQLVQARDNTILEKNAELASRAADLDACHREILDKNHQVDVMHAQMENLKTQIAEILNSSSWKITKPLRAALEWWLGTRQRHRDQ